jgi:iron complex outermembrane receptor protein
MARNYKYLLSFIVAVTATTQVVIAQTAQNPGTAPNANTSEDGLQEIIVTAQRREAADKDVPIAITVLSRETLDSADVRSTADLPNVTPGLRMNSSGVSLNPTIRGVTSQVDFQSDPNVATYIDNVYQQSNLASVDDLPDAVSVQVLKGPQGTLFGRNATGGAILITTRDPDFVAPTGSATISYGRFDETITKGFVSTPLIENVLAGSLAGLIEHRDGYFQNVFTGATVGGLKSELVRGKLLLAPADGVKVILTGVYTNRRDDDTEVYGNLNGNNFARGLIPNSELAAAPNQTSSDMYLYFLNTTKSVSLRATADIGPGTFSSTTAFTDVESNTDYDSDNSPLPLVPIYEPDIGSKTFTQELLYSFQHVDKFNGTLGTFYFHNHSFYSPISIDTAPTATNIYTDDGGNAIGVFGEMTYDASDKVQLAGGVRYNLERRTAAVSFVEGAPVEPASLEPLGRKSFVSVTPRGSILYRLTDATNVYATYSQGFKSGLFNTYSAQATPVVPEKLDAYEIGQKTSVRGFNFDAAAFYYNYKDIQVATFNGVLSQLQNASAARIYGVDLTASWQATHELRVTIGGSFLDAKYTDYPDASVYVPNRSGVPAGSDPCNFRIGTVLNDGNTNQSCNVSGNFMIFSPKESGSIIVEYAKPTDVGTFTLSGNTYVSGRFYFDTLNRIAQGSYATVGGRLFWSPVTMPKFQVGAFVRNLTNREILATSLSTALFDSARYEMPRTFGVQFGYSF